MRRSFLSSPTWRAWNTSMLSNKLTSNHSRTQPGFSSLQCKSVSTLSSPPILLASIRTLYKPLRARCFLRSVKSGAAILLPASVSPACRLPAVTQIRQFVDGFTLPELLEPYPVSVLLCVGYSCQCFLLQMDIAQRFIFFASQP